MGSRILLADDSITIQKVVNLTFADEGIEVVSVSNGDMAERRLLEINPDLVLADIFMPGKNGYELCEMIKKNPQYAGTPVVLLVGAFEPFNEVEARRVQADAHLTKPFESRILVETVRALIERSPKPKVNTASLANGPQESAAPPTLNASAQTLPLPNAVMVPPVNLDMAAMGLTTPAQDTSFVDHLPMTNGTDSTPFSDSFPSSFESQNPYPATIEFTTEMAPAVDHSAPSSDATQTFYTFEQSFEQSGAPAPEQPLPELPRIDVEVPSTEPPLAETMAETPAVEASASDAPVNEDPSGEEATFASGFSGGFSSGFANSFENSFDNNLAGVLQSADPLQTNPEFEGIPPEVAAGDAVVDFEQVDLEKVETFEAPAPESDVSFAVEAETESEPVANTTSDDDDVLKTHKLDTNELIEQANPSADETAGQLADDGGNNGGNGNRDFAFYETTESATTLLRSEEPLGDILGSVLAPDSFTAPAEAQPLLELDEPVAAGDFDNRPEPAPAATPEVTEMQGPGDTTDFTVFPEPLQHQVAPEAEAATAETAATEEIVVGGTDEENPLEILLPTPPEPVQFVKELSSGVEYNFYTDSAQEAPVAVSESDDISAAYDSGALDVTIPEAYASGGTEASDATSPVAAPETSEDVATSEVATSGEAAVPNLPQVESETAAPATLTAEEQVEEVQPEVPSEPFTASDMWTEEPQFTPISVEMSPITENAALSSKAFRREPTEETVSAGSDSREEVGEVAKPAGVDMSQELIDEIVRRVVAQLSDTVVREVAWEVVPDCVERIVTNLTRESLQNQK